MDRFQELNAFIAVVEAGVFPPRRVEPANLSPRSARPSARWRGALA